MDITSVYVAAPDGRGHVVANEAVRGGGAVVCHYRQGHVIAVEDVVSIEVAARSIAM